MKTLLLPLLLTLTGGDGNDDDEGDGGHNDGDDDTEEDEEDGGDDDVGCMGLLSLRCVPSTTLGAVCAERNGENLCLHSPSTAWSKHIQR